MDSDHTDCDVLVTGIGLVTPLALNREASWRLLREGVRAGRELCADEIDHFELLHQMPGLRVVGAPVDHAGVQHQLRRLAAHTASDSMLSSRLARLRDLWLQEPVVAMTLLALTEALADARIAVDQLTPERVGCCVGASKGGLRSAEQLASKLRPRVLAMGNSRDRDSEPLDSMEPNLWFGLQVDAATRAVAETVDARAMSSCPVAACASGLISLLQGAAAIHTGQCDVCVVGSADAALRASVLASFHRLRVTSRRDDPATACRPFDQARDGFVIGEGAAVLILESRAHAKKRGCGKSHAMTSYGRVSGGGWLSDPTGMTQIDASGRIVRELLQRTLGARKSPQVQNRQLHLISLHGTATDSNDLAEARGMTTYFGDQIPPCSAVKGALGHLLGAAGSVETAFTMLSLRDQVIPGSANFGECDSRFRIPLQSETRSVVGMNHAAKLSLGFGGHVACGVFDREDC